jgi:hypothetical protein
MPAAAGGEPAGLAVYLDSIAETARQLHAAACSRPPGATGQRRWQLVLRPVVARLGPDSFGFSAKVVVPSGCYLIHDHGIDWRASPVEGRGPRRSSIGLAVSHSR